MSSTASRAARPLLGYPTIWGLDPVELHDRYWASRGIQIVRADDDTLIPAHAKIFLLTAADTLVMFDAGPALETFKWINPHAMFVRIQSSHDQGYREAVQSAEDGRFVRFQRRYDESLRKVVRIALTGDRKLAEHWQQQDGSGKPWKQLRSEVRAANSRLASADGQSYDCRNEADLSKMVRYLVAHWPQPSLALPHVRAAAPGVWACDDFIFDPSVRFVGPAWVGAGRKLQPGQSVLGPAALWDDPQCRPTTDELDWEQIDQDSLPVPTPPRTSQPAKPWSFFQFTKRIFDIVFAMIALIFSLPIYSLIMLAIWLEDGRPFFYIHYRETLGGRQFPCLKFRSMRKDADIAKAELDKVNQADGPQFYMPGDPRITRVGRKIRRCNLDELPQFLNVLMGHMSIVGPRPSPYSENQCCPSWREARLSVRPGITGLWQVLRTREPGLDFQEWIRFDLQYVQQQGWRMDLWIIYRTIKMLISGS